MNIFLILLLTIGLLACGSESKEVAGEIFIDPNPSENNEVCENNDGINWQALLTTQCQQLSDYNLFTDSTDPRSGQRIGGITYQLNSQLFTDHARKYRYVFMPPNTQATFVDSEVLDFPVGSVFVKVFALPEDTGKPEENIIEVRLMIHRPSGWVGLPYVWDSQVLDGHLDLNGESVPFTMLHKGEEYQSFYAVPTYGSCRNCHQYDGSMTLIGPKARLLNKQIIVAGESVNQLVYWQQEGFLPEGSLPSNVVGIEYAPDWRDETENLTDRAKAYLDINCAHCHRPEGSASLSGLKMEFGRKDIDYDHGVCNSAHGWRGGGFDIWPGDGEISSIPLRMTLSGAPDRMPPLGRSLVDDDAVKLIRQWIDSMPYKECAEQNN